MIIASLFLYTFVVLGGGGIIVLLLILAWLFGGEQ